MGGNLLVSSSTSSITARGTDLLHAVAHHVHIIRGNVEKEVDVLLCVEFLHLSVLLTTRGKRA